MYLRGGVCDFGFSGDGYNSADIYYRRVQRQLCVMVRSSHKTIPFMSEFAGACVTRDSQVTATTARILTSAMSILLGSAELS